MPVLWEDLRMSGLNASWGNSKYAHCELGVTLRELRQAYKSGIITAHPANFKMGGLGEWAQPGLFEIWVCVQHHYCSGTEPPMDGWFCWVLDERVYRTGERAPEQYVPWGHNCDLKLV